MSVGHQFVGCFGLAQVTGHSLPLFSIPILGWSLTKLLGNKIINEGILDFQP